jgi:class 3 adenylate cyclase
MADAGGHGRGTGRHSRQRLQRLLDQREHHLSALREVSREIARAPHEDAVYRIALGTMMGAMGIVQGIVIACLGGEEIRVVPGSHGGVADHGALVDAIRRLPPQSRAALREALPSRAASRHPDGAIRALGRVLRNERIRAWIPLVADGELLGGVCVGDRLTGASYRRTDIELLKAIASHCAATINGYRMLAATLTAHQERFHLQALLEEHVDPQNVALLLGGAGGLRPQRLAVTILVSDLRGFTPLSEQLEPEEIIGPLNRFLARMTTVVMRHGGRIDKFIGDAVMALFQGPEDAPRQAATCALEMQRAFRELQPMPAGGIPDVFAGGMGIGVSTGEVVFGEIGSARRMDLTVVGPPVNLAHRLSGLTSCGILLDTRTYEGVRGVFQSRQVGPMAIKGFGRPVPVYELLAPAEAQGPVPAGAGVG